MEDISEKIEALKITPTALLIEQYKQLFNKTEVPTNRIYLIRQLAYRIQEQHFGGLKLEVQAKIQDLIKSYDPIHRINIKTNADQSGRDPRLPMPGSFITKTYKGNRLEVKVLESGFEYQGTIYKNLSAVAKAVTGAHWNGFAFFGVKNNGRK